MAVRTRFAPSPTGFLHIGGARTALFAWLYAKKYQGQFILRIEDTDVERSTPESVQAIFDGMQWLELTYDEGPFYQTKRLDRYREVIAQLLMQGDAYRCYCSKERLETLRNEQVAQKKKPRYDGHCRSCPAEQQTLFVVRFKNPEQGHVTFHDQIRGDITIENSELDDLIIARSDGMPTYNFSVVVDDWDMKITHVIRGDDHINNTPRQINLFKALQATPPLYAHVPMILGEDGKRLSKREGAASVMDYQVAGILPEALLNYLIRLGWSHGDQEIFSREEMIKYFDLSAVQSSPAALNYEKLLWLNQHYLKQADPERIALLLKEALHHLSIDVTTGPLLSDIVKIQVERVKTIKEMAEKSRYFFIDIVPDAKEREKHVTFEILPLLAEVKAAWTALAVWEPASIHQVILDTAARHEIKLGKLAQAIRVLVTGGTVSPPLDSTVFLIGRERTLRRLEGF